MSDDLMPPHSSNSIVGHSYGLVASSETGEARGLAYGGP